MICPSCGHQNPTTARYCRNEMPIDDDNLEDACPECGSIVPENAKYCSSCGHGLKAQSKSISGIP